MFKKVFSILNKKNIPTLIGILFMVLISSALDLFGVATLLPIVSLLLKENSAIDSSTFLSVIKDIFKTSDTNDLLLLSLIILSLLFLIKALYGILYRYVLSKLALNYSRRLTNKLMNTYLGMPYEYHLENNSSTLIRKSIYDVDNFVNTIFDLLTFVVKIITFLVIFIYLLTISWEVSLITLLLLLVFSLLIIFILKPKTRKLAKQVQKLNSNNYKFLSQAFQGIKESKISGVEHNFSDVYDNNRNEINSLALKRNVYSAIPSNLLEFIGIFAICLSLYVIKKFFNYESFAIIETFTVFVYAVIRLLPLVTTSASIVNSFSYYKASVDTIYEDLELYKQQNNENDNNTDVVTMEFNDSIKFENVSFSYRVDKEKVILKDINLEIKKNTVNAFCGPSGGGKTTTIDLLLGLLNPSSGVIKVDNKDISNNIKGWQKNISYIPQDIYLIDDSIRKNVAFGIKDEDIDNEKVMTALKKAELDEFVLSLDKGLDTVIGERGVRLSGGQAQRIGIARAFYRDTNVIVFDEATSSLDYETEKNILLHVGKMKQDHTLIIITHREENIKDSDSIYRVDNSSIEKIK